MMKWHNTWVVAAALAVCPGSRAAEPAPLSTEQRDKLQQMLRPQADELLWMKVPWVTSITLARHQAAVENKPILIFAVAGAGFSDPLGIC
jgi:hypothetical protein